MELTDITKSNQNLKRNVKDTKLALVFHVKEDGKNYEFGINTIRRKHFSVRCKSCDCHNMIPTPGIEVEETTNACLYVCTLQSSLCSAVHLRQTSVCMFMNRLPIIS